MDCRHAHGLYIGEHYFSGINVTLFKKVTVTQDVTVTLVLPLHRSIFYMMQRQTIQILIQHKQVFEGIFYKDFIA
jgi:hypothetical protein